MYKIALFASHKPGLEIIKFLSKQKNLEIAVLYLTGHERDLDKKMINLSGIKCKKILYGRQSYENDKHISFFKKLNINCIITVYWPWILPKKLYSLSEKTINFHPSLLPSYRGWYPHVHNIIDKTQCGVTLHELNEGADTGKIWIQKKVECTATDNAKDLYKRLQLEIVKLFKKNWKKIKNDQIKPYNQRKKNSSFKKKADVNKYDHIDLNKKVVTKDFINILRARSFGNKSFAYFKEEGKKVYINLKLSY